jgi:RNA polymerase sigma factor (sigma-70 family)
MAIQTLGSTLRQINRLFADGAVTGLSDAQLLERFVGRRDSEAFEAILARHGPMVLGVCRGILRDPNDAEDAFQATFLILIKKAGSIRANVVLGGWLYQVAYRVAVAANTAAARRRMLERTAGEMAAMSSAPGTTISDELFKAAHEALARLPEKYRLAILLCDLEGKPQAQAARELNWSERTLRRRLAAARERIKSRLSRRGWARGDALAGRLFHHELRSAVPTAWSETVVRTAVDTVNRAAAARAVSTAAQSLVREVLWIMLFTGLKQTSTALLALGGLGILAATFAGQSNDKPGRQDQPSQVRLSKPEPTMELAKAAENDKQPVPISGSVVDATVNHSRARRFSYTIATCMTASWKVPRSSHWLRPARTVAFDSSSIRSRAIRPVATCLPGTMR